MQHDAVMKIYHRPFTLKVLWHICQRQLESTAGCLSADDIEIPELELAKAHGRDTWKTALRYWRRNRRRRPLCMHSAGCEAGVGRWCPERWWRSPHLARIGRRSGRRAGMGARQGAKCAGEGAGMSARRGPRGQSGGFREECPVQGAERSRRDARAGTGTSAMSGIWRPFPGQAGGGVLAGTASSESRGRCVSSGLLSRLPTPVGCQAAALQVAAESSAGCLH